MTVDSAARSLHAPFVVVPTHPHTTPPTANLEENERIKAELNPAPIDEPKTPYHAPLPDDGDASGDEAARGVSPLEAGSEGARRFEEALAEREAEDAARGSSVSAGGGARSSATRSSDEWGAGSLPGSLGDEAAESKRRRFEARRRAHYNMRAALRARSGSQDEEEREGGGGGGDDNGDTPTNGDDNGDTPTANGDDGGSRSVSTGCNRMEH